VSVAYKVMVNGNCAYGPEVSVLGQGVEALARVRDQLDEAEHHLARFLKDNNLSGNDTS
jgi:hypothetical protein